MSKILMPSDLETESFLTSVLGSKADSSVCQELHEKYLKAQAQISQLKSFVESGQLSIEDFLSSR